MKNSLLALLCILGFLSCGENDSEELECGHPVVIDDNRYQSIDDLIQSVTIINSTIEGECLTMTIGFSGCDDEHIIDLVTDGSIAESFPVQVYFKLEDQNPQLCLAYFEQTYNYDLEELDDLLGSEPKARLIFPQQGEEILWDRE